MVIVSKEELFFDDGKIRELFVKKVKFSSRSGTFSIELPDTIKTILHKEEVCADTLEDVNNKFTNILKEYKETNTTKRKVITYEIYLNAFIMDKEEERCKLRVKTGTSGGHENEQEAGLGVSYEVCIELDFNGKKSYTREDGGYAYRVYNNIIDWSKERESFFHGLTEELKILVKKTHDFFCDDRCEDEISNDIDKRIDESKGYFLENKITQMNEE